MPRLFNELLPFSDGAPYAIFYQDSELVTTRVYSGVALRQLAEAERSHMYHIYAIYNRRHKKYYIGQTQDLEERLKLHQDHVFGQGYTARFDGEWELFYSEEVPSRQDALVREKQLKSYRGRQFIKEHIPE